MFNLSVEFAEATLPNATAGGVKKFSRLQSMKGILMS